MDKMEEIGRSKGKKIPYLSRRSVEQSGRREDRPNVDREEDLYCCYKKLKKLDLLYILSKIIKYICLNTVMKPL